MTVGVQLRRSAGWRLPDGARSVARPTRWGNPFVVAHASTGRFPGRRVTYGGKVQVPSLATERLARRVACALYAVALYDEEPRRPFAVEEGVDRVQIDVGRRIVLPVSVADVRRELAGRDLACWCPLGEPCHRDVLLAVAA